MDALLSRLSSRQISEWMAYYAIEPFGEERADLRMAILASLIANVNRDPAKRREPFTPAEFMPDFGSPSDSPHPAGGDGQRQTWQQKKAIMMALTRGNE